MLGLGTIINCAGILLGGFFGLFAGRCGHPERQEALQKACGIAVLFIMALVGAIQDGVSRDCSTLAAVLDCVIIAVMTASLGKGCIFSAIPVFVLEGAVTLPAQLLALTELAVSYLSLIGSILIFCVGVNLVWSKLLRVANMLPTIIFAIAFSYLPWPF